MANPWPVELELRGAGGEPVDLWRTLTSHGVAALPPQLLDEEGHTLDSTLSLPRGARAHDPDPRRPPGPCARRGRGARLCRRRRRAGRDRGAHAPARRRPLRLLRGRGRGSRSRLGDRRRGPDAAQPDGVRGRGQDDLHDQLHLVCNGAHGQRARRRAGRRSARRPPRLPHSGRDGRRERGLLPGRRPHRLPRRLPALACEGRRERLARPRGPRRPHACPTTRSRPPCSPCPAAARMRPRT